MRRRRSKRNLRPAIWLGLSGVAFAAAIALQSAAITVFASVAFLGALLSVERYPRARD